MAKDLIGEVQHIPLSNEKLTVIDQKDDKLIIELDDGRYFKSTIKNWEKGFKCLNNLAPSYKDLIVRKGVNKDGRKMEIHGIRDLWKPRQRIKN